MAQTYNNLPTIDIIAATALDHLQDALIVKDLCATDTTGDFNSTQLGYKVGDSISFRTNPVYEVKTFNERAADGTFVRDDTKEIDPQDVRASTRTLSIDKHYDISITLSARELAMDFDKMSEMVIRPAAKTMASKIDAFVASKALQGAGLYASSSIFGTAADMAQARKAALTQQLTEDKFCLVNLDLEAALLGADWFNKFDYRGEGMAYRTGMLSETMGMKFYSSANYPVSTHTNSSGTTTTAASPSGTQNKVGTSSLIVASVTGGFSEGDRIAIAGVKRPLIVKADVSAAATEITLVDPITEIIPASAAVTVVGGNAKALTHKGAIFDSQSIGMAMPVLDMVPDHLSSVVSDSGISIRLVQGYNMSTKVTTLSMDCLVGATALDPRRITLLANAA